MVVDKRFDTQALAADWIRSQLINELVPIPAKLADQFEAPIAKAGQKSHAVH